MKLSGKLLPEKKNVIRTSIMSIKIATAITQVRVELSRSTSLL